ncbi:MAG TPA: rhodanese-like domain-containing protein [Chitinophagaceae bacterium]|jgi:rhodanese-related sulfurtransferase|nr:rhodanese-like domain-containing protein [Chitinophagaceae bacterium]
MRNVFSLFLFFSFLSCKAQPGITTKLNPDDFEKTMKKNDVQLLDVRTAAEFQTGHIKDALQADWTKSKEFNERVQYVDKDRPVYIYCLAGGRSAAAAEWMRNNGYTNVVELTGGINAWKTAGKNLEGSSNEKQMTMDEYRGKITKKKTVLIDFGATWCPPCIKMDPVLDSLEKNKDLEFKLIKIDASIHTDIMKEMNIEPIPVFIIYKDGKETWRRQGIVSFEELKAQLK